MDGNLRRYIGHLDQLLYARTGIFREGRASGTRAVHVKNGPLSFMLLPDKCLDMAELSWRGENISFLSKPGLQGRNHYDTNGLEAQHSIMGGMLFTCGLENVCAPCSSRGRDYAMHGRIRTTPGEHLGIEVNEDNSTLSVRSEMREAELFGRNLVLKREISTRYNSPSIHIHDEVTNRAFKDEPFSILYHINTGYPFLDEGCYIRMNSSDVLPQNRHAENSMDRWMQMDPPADNESEMVYRHDVVPDENGVCSCEIINPVKQLGFRIDWIKSQLKNCIEWKSPVSGDYVLAVEPSNSSFEGRKVLEERGELELLAPGETRTFDLTLSILEGDECI